MADDTTTVYTWTLVFKDPTRNSKKFYRIILAGDNVICHYGRITRSGGVNNSHGRVDSHRCFNRFAAKSRAMEITDAKEAKGYLLHGEMSIAHIPSKIVAASTLNDQYSRDLVNAVQTKGRYR